MWQCGPLCRRVSDVGRSRGKSSDWGALHRMPSRARIRSFTLSLLSAERHLRRQICASRGTARDSAQATVIGGRRVLSRDDGRLPAAGRPLLEMGPESRCARAGAGATCSRADAGVTGARWRSMRISLGPNPLQKQRGRLTRAPAGRSWQAHRVPLQKPRGANSSDGWPLGCERATVGWE